jgi:hypothetical protein
MSWSAEHKPKWRNGGLRQLIGATRTELLGITDDNCRRGKTMSASPPLPDIPLALADLSHQLHITEEQLKILRKQRQKGLDQLLRREQKKLCDYVRQARHRKDPDLDKLERGASLRIRSYHAQKATWDAWMPPYARRHGTGAVSFDSKALHRDGMEIRREYRYPTLLAEPSCPDRPPLRNGITLDDGVRVWLIDLYAKLDIWIPRSKAGRKSTIGDSFYCLRPRRKSLSLTITVANYYLPGLHLSRAMLDKALRARIDEERTSRARQREKFRIAKERLLAPIDRRTTRKASKRPE